jgi:pimeloyl-ACP methyl ester carboxylesterase
MRHKIARPLIKLLPASLGHRLIVALSGKTDEVTLSPAEAEAMASARPLSYGPGGKNTAFEWGAGRLIILMHGWGGRAAQMAPLAVILAGQGFRCVAADVTGHGDTSNRLVRWHYFLRDVEALTQSLQSEVYAYVGHSSGGTTLMAVRRRSGIKAQRFICICSPSYPFLAIDSVRQNFDPGDRVLDRHRQYLAREFGMPWRDLERGGSFDGAGENLLLVYDARDRLVPHSEGDRIHTLCNGSKLIKTNSYGHRRVLTAPELFQSAGDFLARG